MAFALYATLAQRVPGGRVVEARVEVDGFAGAAITLKGAPPCIRVTVGAPSGAVRPVSLDLTAFESASEELRYLTTLDPAAVRATVYDTTGGGERLLWRSYLQPGRCSETRSGGRVAFRLAFAPPYAALDRLSSTDALFGGGAVASYVSLLQIIDEGLGRLDPGVPVFWSCDLRPYVDGAMIGASDNPWPGLFVPSGLLARGGKLEYLRAAMTEALSALGATLHTCEGAVVIARRRDIAAAAGTTLTTWRFDTPGAIPPLASTALSISAPFAGTAYNAEASDLAPPVRRSLHVLDAEPALVANGSFEETTNLVLTTPRSWTLRTDAPGSATRDDANRATGDNLHALLLTPTATGSAAVVAAAQRGAVLPELDPLLYHLRLSADAREADVTPTTLATLAVEVQAGPGAAALRLSTLFLPARTSALPGSNIVVALVTDDPVVAGGITGDRDAVLLPVGAVLTFVNPATFEEVARLTLTQELRLRDGYARGDLDAALTLSGITGTYPLAGLGVWVTTSQVVSLQQGASSYRTNALPCSVVNFGDGERVGGHLYITIQTPQADILSVANETPTTRVDDVALSIEGPRPGVAGYAEQAPYGLSVRERHVVGDGPTEDALTGLRVYESTNGTYPPTLRGLNGGWRRGAYAALDIPPGRTLSEVLAREDVELAAAPRETIRLTAYPRATRVTPFGGTGPVAPAQPSEVVTLRERTYLPETWSMDYHAGALGLTLGELLAGSPTITSGLTSDDPR